jgi:DNA-binding NarL/FixJ family response regulator
LKSLLNAEDDLEVVGEAEDGLEAIHCVNKHQPDLLLLDLAMPKMNGIAAIKEIKKENPGTKILTVTFHTSDEYILAAFQAGADGYCLKNDSHTELMIAIRRALEGKKYISPLISEKVLEGYLEGRQTLKTDTAWETITQREKEVLQLVGEGYTSSKIADYFTLQRKLVIFDKFAIIFSFMRQISSVVSLLYPGYLLNERLKCMTFHRQNDPKEHSKLR